MCPSEFSTASELQRHMKVHNKKTYTCFVCSKSFLKKTSLDTHMVSVHGSDWKPCYFCKRKFRTIVAMRKHMKKCGNRPREVIQFTCRQCRLVFDTRDKLDKHMLSHSVKLVACPQCAMRVSIQDFANHQATHVTYHKRCSACGKRFKSEHELVAHVKRDHVSKDRDGLKCTQCGLYDFFYNFLIFLFFSKIFYWCTGRL